MNDVRHSRTAIATCLMRAVHTKFEQPPLIYDDWADRLVLPEEREEIAAGVRSAFPNILPGGAYASMHAAWKNLSIYAGVIIRTRYAEDKVQAAAARGVRQYVIIGAGMDSFAMRRPDFARDIRIFEVDHPASQKLKCDRLAKCGANIPPSLHFVPADLGAEDLGTALSRSAFQFDQPAIMSWLGVTVYLPREANFATLRSIATFAAPSSEVVFTYIEQKALDSDSPFMKRAKGVAAAMGEPWICGFDSARLPDELRELGLEMVEDIGGQEMQARYYAGRTDGLTSGRAGRIALAVVTTRTASDSKTQS